MSGNKFARRAKVIQHLEEREAELYELLQRDPMNLGVVMRLNNLKSHLAFVREKQLRSQEDYAHSIEGRREPWLLRPSLNSKS